MNVLRFASFALLLTLAGCAGPQDSAIFVTRTSVGLDVDGAPATAAFGYNRVEGYLGPRYDTGTVPAVAGSFHTDGGLFDRKVRQIYATGNAALNATAKDTTTPAQENEHFAGERKAMFFGTATTLGVNMGFGDAGATSFTFGFKRKELSVIPVTTTETSSVTGEGTTTQLVHKFPSVFARLDNTTDAKTQSGANLEVSQFFATGVAAQRLANNADVQKEFREEALDPKLRYRNEEHKQSLQAFGAINCVEKVSEGDLVKVFANAEALGVFKDKSALAEMKAAPTAQAKRAKYVGEMGLMDPNDERATTLVQLHRMYVCELPGAKT